MDRDCAAPASPESIAADLAMRHLCQNHLPDRQTQRHPLANLLEGIGLLPALPLLQAEARAECARAHGRSKCLGDRDLSELALQREPENSSPPGCHGY